MGPWDPEECVVLEADNQPTSGAEPADPGPSGKISTRQKFGWALGGLTDNGLSYGILAMSMPIYNIGLGISAVWLGWALAIPRVLDAVLDPWIGNLSDNTRSRWGRRRPYIFFGAIVSSIAFALVWLPPLHFDKTGLFAYYLVFTIIMFLGYAPYSIGLSALGLELSPDTTERTRAQGLRLIAVNLVGIILPWIYKLCTLPIFGGNEVHGARFVGPALAALLLVAGVLPAILCREQAQAMTQPKIPFWPAFQALITHRPFMLLMAVSLCVCIGTFIVSPMLLYILIYYICGGDKGFAGTLNGYGGTFFAVMGIVLPAGVAAVGIRIGKKLTICIGILLTLAGYAATWFVFTPAHPYWSLLAFPMICTGSIAIFIFTPAMMADICDIDELECGLRREGMFGAVSALLNKGTVAATSVLGGYLLAFAGYVGGETPDAHTLLIMRVLYIAFPVALLLLALALATRYPISEARVREARALLDARKAASGAGAP
jgi:GPH family glycoside/pentoside/hexuronide:cation symporter